MRALESVVVELALTVLTAVSVLVYLKQPKRSKQAFQHLLLAAGFGLAWLGWLIDCFTKEPSSPAVAPLFFLLGMATVAFAHLGMNWLSIRDQVTDLAGKVGMGPKAAAPSASAGSPPTGTPTPPAPQAPTAPPAPSRPEAPTVPPMDLPPKEEGEKPPPPPPPPA